MSLRRARNRAMIKGNDGTFPTRLETELLAEAENLIDQVVKLMPTIGAPDTWRRSPYSDVPQVRASLKALGRRALAYLSDPRSGPLAHALDVPKRRLDATDMLMVLGAMAADLGDTGMAGFDTQPFLAFASCFQPTRRKRLELQMRLGKSRVSDLLNARHGSTEALWAALASWGAKGPKPTIKTPSVILEELDALAVGQRQAKETLAMLGWRQQLTFVGEGAGPRPVGALLGPTGCGKTLLCRGLAMSLNIPFIAVASTQLTETGYVGTSIEDVFIRLYKAAGKDLSFAQKGIVFLDEFDKLCRPAFQNGSRDVGGSGMQGELLAAIEGCVLNLNTKGNMFETYPDFDTSGVLFILGGSFETIRRNAPKAMGFGAGAVAPVALEPKALIDAGMLPELAGRISAVVELDPLGLPEMQAALVSCQGSPLPAWRRLCEAAGVGLVEESEAHHQIAQEAINLGLGARGLAQCLERLFNKALCTARPGETLILGPGVDGPSLRVAVAQRLA